MGFIDARGNIFCKVIVSMVIIKAVSIGSQKTAGHKIPQLIRVLDHLIEKTNAEPTCPSTGIP